MEKEDKIFLAGHKGMVGSSILRLLTQMGYKNIITATKAQLDLRDYNKTREFLFDNNPKYVIIASAKVGGIMANMTNQVEFLFDNLQIQNSLIKNSFELESVEKICFLGSSCIYPKESIQPIKEEYILSGKLEDTNEGYALAKIAGIKLLNYYKRQYDKNSICLMPCNLYGEGDNFDPTNSHVLSALVRKFVNAKHNGFDAVEVWGTGTPLREFLYVDDTARAVLYFMGKTHEHIDLLNIGSGEEISIKELANLIAKISGFEGKIIFDTTKPDGMKRKLMDISKMKELGFSPKVDLETGIKKTIKFYKERQGIA